MYCNNNGDINNLVSILQQWRCEPLLSIVWCVVPKRIGNSLRCCMWPPRLGYRHSINNPNCLFCLLCISLIQLWSNNNNKIGQPRKCSFTGIVDYIVSLFTHSKCHARNLSGALVGNTVYCFHMMYSHIWQMPMRLISPQKSITVHLVFQFLLVPVDDDGVRTRKCMHILSLIFD